MNINHIKVVHRLPIAILGLLALVLLLAGSMLYRFMALEAELARFLRVYDHRIELALQWQGLNRLNLERVVVATSAHDAGVSAFLDDRLQQGNAQIDDLYRQVAASVAGSAEQDPLAQVARLRARVLALQAEVLHQTEDQAFQLVGGAAKAQTFLDQQFLPAINAYTQAIDAFLRVLHQRREAALAEAEASRRQALGTGLALALGVLAVAVLFARGLIRSITHPLRRALALSEAMAEGHLGLDQHDERQDEFGQLLRSMSSMSARLRVVVAEVRGGVDAVSTASSQIAISNHDLSRRTEQMAGNLQQTAASIEQLTSTVAQSAQTASEANQLALTVAQAAMRGGDVVAQVVSSMEHITDSARRIADIIGVIDGIAFQTNILALNAAVEAARAGEQGRGFAVVATEVRGLAQRSAEAAKEIKGLITSSADRIESGARQVNIAGVAMSDIVQGVRRVSDLIADIAAGASEQHQGIGQTHEAMSRLDRMTQQNAALVDESAAAAAALRDQALNLSEVVAIFKLGSAPVANELALPMGARS
ncbi:MAG: hypothetical protein RLZZ22_295 [Pseudomonadota bacterium]